METSMAIAEEKEINRSSINEGKFLTFELGGEIYGLEILKVQEIIGIMDVTRLPKTPDYMRGIINLRGKVIPVMDLRRKFELDHKDDNNRTCIIVVQVVSDDNTITMGILVDEVSEVLDIEQNQISDTPSLGSEIETDFILGIGKVEEKVVMLLDIDTVLTTKEIKMVKKISEQID